MVQVAAFNHVDEMRVSVASSAPRLYVLDHRLAGIEAYNDVAARDVQALFCNRSRKEAIDLALTEFGQRQNLLTNGRLYCVRRLCADKNSWSYGRRRLRLKERSKNCGCDSLLHKHQASIVIGRSKVFAEPFSQADHLS